jgi:hypothetical protein
MSSSSSSANSPAGAPSRVALFPSDAAQDAFVAAHGNNVLLVLFAVRTPCATTFSTACAYPTGRA